MPQTDYSFVQTKPAAVVTKGSPSCPSLLQVSELAMKPPTQSAKLAAEKHVQTGEPVNIQMGLSLLLSGDSYLPL